MNRMQQVIRDTEVITAKPIDQRWGDYKPAEACCVGARLARFFNVAEMCPSDYRRGMKAFAKALGGTTAHVILMLRLAGAGESPFSSSEWPIPPEDVWENLKYFEELPELRGNSFKDESFVGQVFDNLNLSTMMFELCDMRDVTFKDCIIRFTSFRNTDMHRSTWDGCEIVKCDFTSTNLSSADFRGATVRDCEFNDAQTMDVIGLPSSN